MYLKELTAAGFKSFASTTRFRFEPGITAIVGPNGSGKSNVVDALAWVMGEQGAKSLRGANMADVIFAGGTNRGALGRAHVELTIDNSDGRLPISYSEVTISRTMFRSGGSEYAINRQPVRLLDVQELLSDSGLGRQMHVIVGQGQLDAVLSAAPADRRAFIDEAAGVAKHRRRKERALRKLDAMDANLVRVLDLTEEMRTRLRPLARQAKAAREAAGVRYALGYASARLLADDLVTVRARRDRERSSLDELRTFGRAEEERLGALKQEYARLTHAESQARTRADEVGERYRDFTEQRERLVSLEEIARERAASAERVPIAVSLGAVELAEQRAKEAGAEASRAAKELEEAEENQNLATSRRKEAEPVLRQAETDLSHAESQTRQAHDDYSRLIRGRESAEVALEAARGQAAATAERLAAAQRRHAECQDEVSRFVSGQSLDNPEGAAGAEAATYERATSNERIVRDLLTEAERNERAASEEVSRLQSRRQTLEDSIAPPKSDRRSAATPSEADSRALGQELTSGPRLDEMLSVRRGWEEALTALLGPMLTARVLRLGAYRSALSRLPSHASAPEWGIPGLVDTGGKPADEPSPDQRSLAHRHGLIYAPDLLEGNSDESLAAELLLTQSWVCETSGEASAFFEACEQEAGTTCPDQTRVATRAGLVLGPSYVRLRGQQESSILSLKADLAETAVLEKDAVEAMRSAREASVQARRRLKAATAAKDEALTALRKADAQRAQAAQEQVRLEALSHAAQVEVTRVEQQVEQAQERVRSAETAWEKARDAVPDRRPEDSEALLASARARVKEASEALSRAREAESEARLAVHVARERSSAADRQARAFSTQAQTIREDRERQLARQAASARAAGGFHQVMERAREGARRAQEAAARALVMRTQARESQERLAGEVVSVSERVADIEAAQKDLAERLLQTEVAYASQSAELKRLEERARLLIEDYGRLLNLRTPSLAHKYGDLVSSPPSKSEGTVGSDEGEYEEGEPEQDVNVDALAADALVAAYGPHLPWAPQPPGEPADQVEPDRDETQTAAPKAFDRDQARVEQQRAERALARLGVVNPLAIEEYEAASARYTFLQEQVEDLNRSKADLLDLIKEVDEQVRAAFTAAFVDTAEKFERTFAALFPGGVGRLELTDPDDPLGTGVEIYARPSGKRVTRLSLLSGGERSLAALAYLIAIFQARPSPFYVLDEIEAALDDINLGRVLGLLEELRQESQLLIITHQKRTMEFADALYGVTMKDGVTAVMSHRMSDG